MNDDFYYTFNDQSFNVLETALDVFVSKNFEESYMMFRRQVYAATDWYHKLSPEMVLEELNRIEIPVGIP